MRQTSIFAYHSLGSQKIGERQKQALHALEEIFPACNRQISEHSHLPINVVTPRVGELVKMGKIVEAYRDLDVKTGRRVIFWKPSFATLRDFGDN